MNRTVKILISDWSRTRKFNRLLHAGKAIAFDFSHNSHWQRFVILHSRVTRWPCSTSNFYALIGQNLTGGFMRKIYAASGNLLTDSWSWQSFVSSCDVLNCLFLLGVQNEIQLLSRLFCNSWLVCLLLFLLTNAPLVKIIGNPISDGIVFKKWAYSLALAWGVQRGLKSLKRFWSDLMTFRSSISTGKPEQLLFLMCFVFFPFPEVERSLCG